MTFQAYIHPNETVPEGDKAAYNAGREVTRHALLYEGPQRPIAIGKAVMAYAERIAAPLRQRIAELEAADSHTTENEP